MYRRIRDLREDNDLKQEDLGKMLNCTDAITVRQFAQHFRWYVPFSIFIIGVAGLCAVEQLCQVLLLQITILPQVSYPPVHNSTPFALYFHQYIQNKLLYCVI